MKMARKIRFIVILGGNPIVLLLVFKSYNFVYTQFIDMWVIVGSTRFHACYVNDAIITLLQTDSYS